MHLLVGLRANEVLLVIPLVDSNIDDYISKTVKWQIPLNTKVIGIFKSKMITDEEKEKWNDKVKEIQKACKNEQIGILNDFLEVVPHDAATTLTSTEGFVFRLDGTVVKAELDSQECKRGLLQAKYVYLTLRL